MQNIILSIESTKKNSKKFKRRIALMHVALHEQIDIHLNSSRFN